MLLISELMKCHGYEVIEEEDGEKGLERARKETPDLIILDIQIPRIDGFTFLKLIRNEPNLKAVKIIALTSYAMKGDREKILAAGANEYVSKPINTRQLPEIIKKWIL